MELPPDLRGALDVALAGLPGRELTRSVATLIERYRADVAAPDPILAGEEQVMAYAAYRMSATFAAARVALAQVASVVPELRPTSQVDLGGGTGAAAWAAIDVFPGLVDVQVVDRSAQAV